MVQSSYPNLADAEPGHGQWPHGAETPSERPIRRSQEQAQAVTRIPALTGSPPETLGPGSKERKSLLVNLAASLGLDVDTEADKPELGRQIATMLGVSWTSDCWSSGQTITLAGLNQLLGGTHREVARRSSDADRQGFHPARSKLEAVTRISSLTDGPPQALGPGSKERKSVLTDLAAGLDLAVDTTLSKPALAREIVTAMNGVWDETCWSTGHTITLEGLNRVLAMTEATLSQRGSRDSVRTFSTPAKEAAALLAALSSSMPGYMNGKACVREMLAAESKHWAQDEWRGFYFEFVGLPALVNTFGGGPTAVANTTFDYSLGEIWDLKCHGDDSHTAILNAKAAIDECLKTRGVGLLVLSGTTETDDGEFRAWHRDLRVKNGRVPRRRTRPPAFQRRSKCAFSPTRLDAFFIASASALDSASRLPVSSR